MNYQARKLINTSFHNSNKGFTLVEILIATCLFTFLIGLVVSMMSFSRKNFTNVNSREWQIQQTESFLLKAKNELCDALYISKPEIGKRGKLLEFTTAANEDISYILSEDGILTRNSKGGKSVKKVLEDVSTLQFCRDSANIVGIELIIGKKAQKKYQLLTSLYGWNIKP